jgi:predicted nucleic acid-binding protein
MTDALYIDTSCMLKLVVTEHDSRTVAESIADERAVVFSSLGEVELRSRLLARRRGGELRFVEYRSAIRRFEDLVTMDPFAVHSLPGGVFDVAIAQLKKRGAVHCRSLDRLHIAAMKVLGLERLLTADDRQARSAKATGMTVTLHAS